MCRLMQSQPQETDVPPALIRLATADSLCAPLVEGELSALRRQYPQLSVRLTTAGTTELFRLLDQNEVDMVCTLDSHIYSTNYVIASEEKVGVHFVVGAGHPLADKGTISRQELLEQDLLLTERGMSYRRLLDEWLARDNLELQPVLEMGRADLLCELVERGMGMSFLPDYVTEAAVARGTVVRLDAEGFQPELWKQLLYRRDKWLSRPMEAAIDHLAKKTEENRAN